MIDEVLDALNPITGPNRPGVSAAWIVPLAGIAKPTDFATLYTSQAASIEPYGWYNIRLLPGSSWLPLSTIFTRSFEFKEDSIVNAQGTAFTYTLTQELPHDDYNALGAKLRACDRYEWVIYIKEYNGQCRLMGYINGKGARFKSSFDSGKQQSGPSAHKIGFAWECGERALYMGPPTTYIALNAIGYTCAVLSAGSCFNADITVLAISPVNIVLQYFDGTSWLTFYTFTTGTWVVAGIPLSLANHLYTIRAFDTASQTASNEKSLFVFC
jgi:hypothetical protein